MCVTLEPSPTPGGGGVTRPPCSGGGEGGEGRAGTLERGRHARVRGHTAPCPNIPPRWPFLVCRRGAAGGASA